MELTTYGELLRRENKASEREEFWEGSCICKWRLTDGLLRNQEKLERCRPRV